MTPTERGKLYAAQMRLLGELLAISCDEDPDDVLDPLTAEDRQVLLAAGCDADALLADERRKADAARAQRQGD